LQRFGKPIKNSIRPQSYVQVQTWFDGPPLDPNSNYLKGGFVRGYFSGLVELLAQVPAGRGSSRRRQIRARHLLRGSG
jgi:hypothetical protein